MDITFCTGIYSSMSENYRYSIIPAGAITDRRLEPRDLQVLCLLGRHTEKGGWCFRSQVKMAREIDCSRSSVQRSIDRLVAAGWLQKKPRATGDSPPDPDHPHAAYAYRVVLDRDDVIDQSEVKEEPSQPSPSEGDGVPTGGQGVPTQDGQGVPTYAWAHEPSLVNQESERETRAREKKDKRLTKLKSIWPTAAHDDQAKIDREWAMLPDGDRDEAVDRAPDFIADAKRAGRKHVPALWKYLEERRWKLLKAKAEIAAVNQIKSPHAHPIDSREGRALSTLAKIADYKPLIRENCIIHTREITPQILAFADAPPEPEWEDYPRACNSHGAYVRLLANIFGGRGKLDRGWIRAPWPFPPSVEGKIYTSTDAPKPTMTEADEAYIAEHGI